eukprot:TRINITY_DN3607_c0_g1_i3.p1 TRINITY_DN3607_c0_g1~~TRINITY_DN3607_c0_g1_i3.p1  ORF type:complete len:118 (+),score=18.00 TRINITY_DN3607_c0_g1_i3:685-1038(+)
MVSKRTSKFRVNIHQSTCTLGGEPPRYWKLETAKTPLTSTPGANLKEKRKAPRAGSPSLVRVPSGRKKTASGSVYSQKSSWDSTRAPRESCFTLVPTPRNAMALVPSESTRKDSEPA